jgi:hypothetical protein
MVLSRRLVVGSALLLVLLVDGFAPPTSYRGGYNNAKFVATRPTEEKSSLTDTDEELLFGGSSVEFKGRSRKVTAFSFGWLCRYTV